MHSALTFESSSVLSGSILNEVVAVCKVVSGFAEAVEIDPHLAVACNMLHFQNINKSLLL